MKHVQARAPGKLVMAGEYAVLEGSPALVMALDHHARVAVAAAATAAFQVDAPDLGIHGARAVLEDGRLRWQGLARDLAARLKLVTAVLESLAADGIVSTPLGIRLDTSACFDPDGRGKLGLGSSAALTVALTAAIRAFLHQPAPDVAGMLAMHRRMQDGRGSGLDIATSLTGGCIAYRLDEGRPQVRRVTWPADVAWRAVWSGRPASTGTALARLAVWRADHAAACDACMRELDGAACAVLAAAEVGDGAAMLEAVAAHAAALAALGRASGIDIVCDEHRALAAIAADCGVAYKTCGAGGGDVGVALACDAEALNHFVHQATQAGFRVLDAGMDADGLVVQTNDEDRRQAWTMYA